MSKKLLSLVLVLALAGMASAATIQWVGPGASDPAGAWEDASNWNGAIAEGDTVKAYHTSGTQGANITVNDTTVNFLKLQNQSWGGACNIEVKSGAVLQLDGSVEQGKGAYTTLMLIDAGGVVKAAQKFTQTTGTYKLSSAAGTADVVDIYGTLQVKGSMATSDLAVAQGAGAGTGRVYVRGGGLLDVDAYSINGGLNTGGTAKRGMILIASGGIMRILGNATTQVNNDITAGNIVGLGSNLHVWTKVEGGQTYTYVPEPATIALLGLGSLVLLRRKR